MSTTTRPTILLADEDDAARRSLPTTSLPTATGC